MKPRANLNEEQLKKLEINAHQNWLRARKFAWVKVPLGIVAFAIATATFFDVVDHGLQLRDFVAFVLSGVLGFWPWYSERMERHWFREYTSILEERARRS